MSDRKIIYEEEKLGNLGFTIHWMSLDGRPQYKEHETFKDAYKHYLWLKDLGRVSSIYHRVDITKTENEIA